MDNMEIRAKYKDIEVNGRKFRLNKFDAMTGTFMMVKISGMLAPAFKNMTANEKEMNMSNIDFMAIAQTIGNLSEEQFKDIQSKSLKIIEELLPAGPQKILDNYGNWGVKDIEDNTALVLNLTIQSIKFNVESFFGESPLSSILKGLNITLPDSLT